MRLNNENWMKKEKKFLCMLGLGKIDQKSEKKINVTLFFSPKNTVSPLHQDPCNNLLSQIVGSKKIVLIDHQFTSKVYPFSKDDRMKWNSSQIDSKHGQ